MELIQLQQKEGCVKQSALQVQSTVLMEGLVEQDKLFYVIISCLPTDKKLREPV